MAFVRLLAGPDLAPHTHHATYDVKRAVSHLEQNARTAQS